AILAVFRERSVLQPLLVAQFHAAEIEHAVLHGAEDALAPARAQALIQCRADTEREGQSGAGIADLRARHQRWAFADARGGRRTAGALRDVLIDLAVLIRTGTEAFHRGHDHARIELVHMLPGETHAVEGSRREIFHQHVAGLHQPLDDLLAPGVLGVD